MLTFDFEMVIHNNMHSNFFQKTTQWFHFEITIFSVLQNSNNRYLILHRYTGISTDTDADTSMGGTLHLILILIWNSSSIAVQKATLCRPDRRTLHSVRWQA